MRNRSSIRTEESLFVSKDLTDSSETIDTNCNQMDSLKEVSNSQSTDRIGVRKSTQLGEYTRQMSQTLVDRIEDWKGSQVVNYKTFKKVLHNSSQTSNERVVPLKRVKIDSNLDLSSNQTFDESEGKPSDSELSFSFVY